MIFRNLPGGDLPQHVDGYLAGNGSECSSFKSMKYPCNGAQHEGIMCYNRLTDRIKSRLWYGYKDENVCNLYFSTHGSLSDIPNKMVDFKIILYV